MKRLFMLMLLAASCMLSTGCASLIRKAVNKQYPPVSSLDKSAIAVQESMQALNAMPASDLGVKLDKVFVDSLFALYFNDLFKKDPSFGVAQISKVELLQAPAFELGKQEVILSGYIRLYLKANKYVKDMSVKLSGRLSPYVSTDSLILQPSFQKVEITQLHLTRCIILSPLARGLVNSLSKQFMDNINGQIKDFVVKINYPPIPALPLSQLVAGDDNIKVINDDTFRLPAKVLQPAILVNPKCLAVMGAIVNKDTATHSEIPDIPASLAPLSVAAAVSSKVMTGASGPVKASGSVAAAGPVTPAAFEALYRRFDSAWQGRWREYLAEGASDSDSLSSVRLSYAALGRITDELFGSAKFALQYNLSFRSDFPVKDITLGDIPKPDCGAISFDCQFNNCNNVLSDCGSCGFFDVLCHGRWVACQAANGVKWAACQASNAAKATWCAGELVARKALCYTELAGIFIYDNLFKNVGSFGGSASGSGTIVGNVTKVLPSGLQSLDVQADISGVADADVQLAFNPSGVLGHLICVFPFTKDFRLTGIHTNNQAMQLSAALNKVQESPDNCTLDVNFRKTPIPIQFSDPLLVEILKDPLLTLNCTIGIVLGVEVGSVLALAGNDDFKNYLRAALLGSYTWELEKSLHLRIPGIPFKATGSSFVFRPKWGEKTLLFIKK